MCTQRIFMCIFSIRKGARWTRRVSRWQKTISEGVELRCYRSHRPPLRAHHITPWPHERSSSEHSKLATLAQMASNAIPTDAQVWKQVRKCLSMDEADDETVSWQYVHSILFADTELPMCQPVPPFLFEPIKQFMTTNPEDDEFVIECHVPGQDTHPFGIISCMFRDAGEACNAILHLISDRQVWKATASLT